MKEDDLNFWKTLFFSFSLLGTLALFFSSAWFFSSTESITGFASAEDLNVSITVSGFPALTIVKPRPQIYFFDHYLVLNVSTNGTSVWFNQDAGTNRTFTSTEMTQQMAQFNSSEGNRTLYVFSNGSNGDVTEKNVTFNVNLTILNISFSNFFDNASTTNLYSYSFEEVQNLSDLVLERETYGKIVFNELINLTDDWNVSDRFVSMDSFVNISYNFIEVNSTGLPNFDTSATLILYGLNFTNPRILKDGVVCSSSDCTENSYSGGDLSFNVTGFSFYSAEETPSGSGGTGLSPGGGGGGGSSRSVTESFSVDKDNINLAIKQGRTRAESIKITNVGQKELLFKLSAERIDDFVKIAEPEFTLAPGESKVISLDFFSRIDSATGLYLGKVVVEADGAVKEILVALNVQSIDALFDVLVDLTRDKLEIGSELTANIKLFEVRDIGQVDVALRYGIKDLDGNEIVHYSETVAVRVQANFVKTLDLPSEIAEGDYVFFVDATYSGQTAGASAFFKIVDERPFPVYAFVSIFLASLVVVVVLVILKVRRDDKFIRQKLRQK